MEILVVGAEEQLEECRRKFGEGHVWHVCGEVHKANREINQAEVIFNFVSVQLKDYPQGLSAVIFMDASAARLSDLTESAPHYRNRTFGFCGLPTLINREVLEVSRLAEGNEDLLLAVCKQLGTPYEVVADQAGLVTARVICMIINEAFLTLEEGIATREDIDLAMRLGTNYPWGPFEWADRIGIKNVVSVLNGAQKETGDERYKVCRLLHEKSGNA